MIQAKLGDSIRLECNASGDQPLSIDWFREGNNATIEKHGNDLYDIHESATDQGVASFMQIRAVKQDDGLLYKCLAKNEFGSSERLIKLIVLGVPERPSQVRVRDIWSRSALVTWLAQYPGNSNRVTNYTVQYWRKNTHSPSAPTVLQQNHRREETVVDGLQSSALLVSLLPAITYEVSVIAHNQVGRSEPSETVNVTTSEEEPSAPPTDVLVEPRGSSSLRVMWKVPPAESLNGKLLGFYIGYRPRSVATHQLLGGPIAPLIQSQINSVGPTSLQQQQQQQQQIQSHAQQSVIYSFKTADAIEGLQYYDTFLTNLKPNQDYEITVRAFNKAGSGPDCHTILARTNPAKLPPAPNLQVQRVTPNSVTLRWVSTVVNGAGPRAGPLSSQLGQPSIQMEILRYILYYQLLGDREWYELTVARSSTENEPSGNANAEAGISQKPLPDTILGVGEIMGSQSSVHTLSNLQSGVSYRIYVAAANDYGVGDPSNVITLKTESLNSTSSAYLGSALLDSTSSRVPGFFEAWGQQHGFVYTILSSIALIMMVLIVAAYMVWQYRLKHKYNSSTASSYPTSWTPAASDTIQSEYSTKRYPGATLTNNNNGGNATGQSLGIYDDVANRHRPFNHQFHSSSRGRQAGVNQQHQLLRDINAGSGTTARPVLSSHYYQPADLISGTGTLQPALSCNNNSGNMRQPKSSSTLVRNQNRQLPPIPYSTLSVKEIGASGGSSKSQWRQHQQQQQSDFRLCNEFQQQVGTLIAGAGAKQHLHQQHQSTGGSQTPLIYGVID